MHKITTLKNGLTLITIDLPHLDSVTTLVAIGAGSRYETKKINGVSHFLEHMFFKGSRKFPSAEEIASLVDGIGAVNNAATDKEETFYWIKSASKHIELATDILSSMIKESLLVEEEINKEKGVIIEELRMIRDDPSRYIWSLYEELQFGDQPLGWDVGGDEKTILSLDRQDFINYMDSLYAPTNMALVYAGKIPKNIEKIALEYFSDLPKRSMFKHSSVKLVKQTKPQLDIFYKETDQVNLVLGMEGFDRNNSRKYALRILSAILGEGMSSRLFLEVREKRGLAYHVGSHVSPFKDTGYFAVYGGLKLEKIEEGLQVMIAELERIVKEPITDEELKKGKEMIRGRLALATESTNFLAQYFGTKFILDRRIETFEEYLKKIDIVTKKDVQDVAKELFQKNKFNLQIIGPFKEKNKFEKILKG